MILPWTALRPSAIERRWRAVAVLVATGICVALIIAGLVRDPRHPALLWAGIAGAVAATLVAVRSPRPPHKLELAIDYEGSIRARSVDGPAALGERSLRAVFGAPWLISLSDGTILLAVWPDSMPEDSFRRLWVCVRWARAARTKVSGAQRPGPARSAIQNDPS